MPVPALGLVAAPLLRCRNAAHAPSGVTTTLALKLGKQLAFVFRAFQQPTEEQRKEKDVLE